MSWSIQLDKSQNFINRVRELLEIKKAKANKGKKVLNHDEGNLVKTSTWTPLFVKLTVKKANTKSWRQI